MDSKKIDKTLPTHTSKISTSSLKRKEVKMELKNKKMFLQQVFGYCGLAIMSLGANVVLNGRSEISRLACAVC